MSYDFQTPGPIDGNIQMAAGILEITAGRRDTTSVLVEALDSSESSANAVRDTKVEMRGNQLYVGAPERPGWRPFSKARLRVVIEMPLDSTLQLRLASADATVRGRYHEVVVHNASGHVWLEDVTGSIRVNTASGRIQLGAVGGDCRVNTASGNIRVRQVTGTVVVHSASGNVEIGDAGSHVAINTASGSASVGVARAGDVKINAASGSVQIGVAAGTGVWLDLNTASGRTTSDLDMKSTPPAEPRSAAALTIKARTASGDITLRRVVAA